MSHAPEQRSINLNYKLNIVHKELYMVSILGQSIKDTESKSKEKRTVAAKIQRSRVSEYVTKILTEANIPRFLVKY